MCVAATSVGGGQRMNQGGRNDVRARRHHLADFYWGKSIELDINTVWANAIDADKLANRTVMMTARANIIASPWFIRCP